VKSSEPLDHHYFCLSNDLERLGGDKQGRYDRGCKKNQSSGHCYSSGWFSNEDNAEKNAITEFRDGVRFMESVSGSLMP
jgi:hypothetical protein